MALALGVSVASATTIGGDNSAGDNGLTTGDKYFVVDSGNLPNTPVLGTLSAGSGSNGEKIDLVWSGASGLVKHDENQGYGGSIQAKNVVVQYGSDNNTLNITGSNASTTTFTFINSTFVGNIISQQNNKTTNTFQGNGTYTAGDNDGTTYAFVGNIIGQGQGSNLNYNFTQGANFKGKIYGEAGTINAVFSNSADSGNTLKGVIGREGGEGYTNVTFKNNATISSYGSVQNTGLQNSGGNFLASYAGDGSAKSTLILQGATNNLTGNIWARVNGGGSSATLIDIQSGNTTTLNGNMSALLGGTNTIQVASGTLNFTGTMTAKGSTNKNSKSYNAIKFSGSATGSIGGNIVSNGAMNYIVNTGSGALNVGGNKTDIYTLSYEGGGTGATTYITDYDSSATPDGGFQQAPTGNGATLALSLKQVRFENGTGGYWKQQGQQFIVDYNTGTAEIDSGEKNKQSIAWTNQYGNTVVLRFRDSASGTSSITLGSSDNNNGNVYSNGLNARVLLQAHAITAYGDIKSIDGSKVYIWGNQITADNISVSLADTNGMGDTRDKGKAIVVSDGANSSIKLNKISVDGGKAYVLLNANTTSTTIGGKDNSSKVELSLSGSGGNGNASIYVTDYDSTETGYAEKAAGNTSSVTLDASKITFANNSGNGIGQTFVLDSYKGSASFQNYNSGNNGNTSIIRFRSATDDTSINIGNSANPTTINTSGIKAKTLFQAQTINIHGNISTKDGGATTLAGLGTNSTINVDGAIINSGNNSNTLTLIQSANIKAGAIYGLSTSNGDGYGTFKFDDSTTSAGVNIGLLAAVKPNGGGGGNFTQNLILDNSSTSNTFTISAVDFSKSTLTLRGGNHSNRTLQNNGSSIALNGNVALYNNTMGSTNTVDVKVGTSSNAYIIGDIITEVNGGSNNIKMIGATNSTPLIAGNIITTGGNTNIILENAIFAPKELSQTSISYAISNPQVALLNSYAKQYGTGKISTSSGKTTIISRLSSDLVSGKTSIFEVNSTGGETNIVTLSMANSIHMQSYVNYSSGVVNMIFANSNNAGNTVVGGSARGSATESFTGTTNAATNTFFGLTYQDGVKLALQDKKTRIGNQENVSLLQTYGNLYKTDNGSFVHIDSLRSKVEGIDTVSISGFAVGTISQLDASSTTTTYNVTLGNNSAFAGNILLDTSKSKINLIMGNASKLILIDPKTTLQTLTLSGNNTINQQEFALDSLAQTSNTVINLATGGASSNNTTTTSDFRVLVIGDDSHTQQTGLQGNGSMVFVNYVNANADQSIATIGGDKLNAKSTAYADRIVIKNAGDNSTTLNGKYFIQLAVDANSDLSSIKYTENTGGTTDTTNTNIAVATIVKKTSASSGKTEQEIRNMGVIAIEEANSLQGFDVLSGSLKAVETDVNGATNGTGGYITYFVNSIHTTGTDSSIQDATASVFATNLDIFMANFNSLNKRMGELRDNNNSQGAWARVFGGSQSSSFGLGSKTSYVTTQAGYDYALGMNGANNYLGVAVAYGYSSSSISNATNTLNGASEGIEGNLKSNMVEVALYNSYVQDSGWYNDTIFKFDYIMNNFNASGTAMGNTVDTNTFGIILSDEFGYRFKLGSEKEWYIDPQAEFSFGYVNGTEYTLVSGNSALQAKSDSMMQLRSRFGSSFGYDFKKFTENKPIKASVYVGAFYEYDYLSGGDVTLTTNLGGVNCVQSSLASDGRVVMNIGTNMTIKDNTRIYFDFESSFAGKINTDYQVNVGVRYSFGENTSYMPTSGAKKEIAPLKVSEEKTEESKEAGKTEKKTTESKTEENKAQ